MNRRFACTASALCLAAFAAMVTAGGAGGGKLEGKWIATGAISRGKKVPAGEIAKAMGSCTFMDGKFSMKANGEEVDSGTYKVDASKQPATIDMTVNEGKRTRKQFGIYKIEGNTLTLAIAVGPSSTGKSPPPPPRPKDFQGKGKYDEVMTFKRGK